MHGIEAEPTKIENDIEENPEEDNADENLEEDELILKCYKLGKQLDAVLKADAHQLYLQNNSVKHTEILNNYKSSQWLLQRPQELLHLISSLCQVDVNTAGTNKLNLVAKIMELIYYCRNSKLVLPIHFTENVIRSQTLNYILTV